MFNNREEVLQFAKIGLNQIRGFCKGFKQKSKENRKRKKRKKKKNRKGPAAAHRPGFRNGPRPTSPPSRIGTRPSPSAADKGAPLVIPPSKPNRA
jgi:hypothetical protein